MKIKFLGMSKHSGNFPFWMLTFAFICLVLVSQLIQDGMFMDGMIYVTVSKNLAEGLGTFWDPYFSQTYLTSYHEQPPLYFGLLALFFKILGNSMYVERLFCLCCFSVTAFYIHKFWQLIYHQNKSIAQVSWFPLLIWTLIPVCFWSYTNQVEETVMVIFATISVYYQYKALFLKQNILLNLLLAGLFVFLSGFTKGVQGMFPLAACGLYWIFYRDTSLIKIIRYSLIVLSVSVVIYGLLWLTIPEFTTSYVKYYQDRYVPTFNQVMNTTSHRYDILVKLFLELIPSILIVLIIHLLTRKFRKQDDQLSDVNRHVYWLVGIGLAGSIPLMVTLEQRGFYLNTVLPFFALAISLFVGPRISTLIQELQKNNFRLNTWRNVSLLVLIGSIVFTISRIGEFKRDKNKLTDIYLLGAVIQPGTTISVPYKMHDDWSLRAYLMRYFNISVSSADSTYQYYIQKKDLPLELVPPNYELYDLGSNELDLYIRKDSLVH